MGPRGASVDRKVDYRVRRFLKDSISVRGKGETRKRGVGK
jgi:hypothetical protein